MKLCRIVPALDCRMRQFRERMADEGRVHTALAIKLLLKGKNHQGFVDVIAQQAHTSLSPGPELRCYIIDRGNAALFHLARDTPVECRGVDNDDEIRLALVRLIDQMPIETENLRQMAENLGDADNRKILGVDDRLAPGGPHAVSAHAKEFKPALRVSSSVLCGDSLPRLSGGAKLRWVSRVGVEKAAVGCPAKRSPPQRFNQLRPIHF